MIINEGYLIMMPLLLLKFIRPWKIIVKDISLYGNICLYLKLKMRSLPNWNHWSERAGMLEWKVHRIEKQR
jgi:hypothetical protein